MNQGTKEDSKNFMSTFLEMPHYSILNIGSIYTNTNEKHSVRSSNWIWYWSMYILYSKHFLLLLKSYIMKEKGEKNSDFDYNLTLENTVSKLEILYKSILTFQLQKFYLIEWGYLRWLSVMQFFSFFFPFLSHINSSVCFAVSHIMNINWQQFN